MVKPRHSNTYMLHNEVMFMDACTGCDEHLGLLPKRSTDVGGGQALWVSQFFFVIGSHRGASM